MVLPVWEKYPVIITTKSIEESSTISVGTPLFLKVKDIRGIHKLIPSKTIAGLLVGPLVGVGRGVFFSGYYIISESGRVIWLETEHHTAKSVFLSREGKKELLEAFREFEQVYLLPASDVWLSMGKRKKPVFQIGVGFLYLSSGNFDQDLTKNGVCMKKDLQ